MDAYSPVNPLHRASDEEAGAPPVGFTSPPVAFAEHPPPRPLRPDPNMNYIISYTHGPPYVCWWPSLASLIPKNYPLPPQQPNLEWYRDWPPPNEPFKYPFLTPIMTRDALYLRDQRVPMSPSYDHIPLQIPLNTPPPWHHPHPQPSPQQPAHTPPSPWLPPLSQPPPGHPVFTSPYYIPPPWQPIHTPPPPWQSPHPLPPPWQTPGPIPSPRKTKYISTSSWQHAPPLKQPRNPQTSSGSPFYQQSSVHIDQGEVMRRETPIMKSKTQPKKSAISIPYAGVLRGDRPPDLNDETIFPPLKMQQTLGQDCSASIKVFQNNSEKLLDKTGIKECFDESKSNNNNVAVYSVNEQKNYIKKSRTTNDKSHVFYSKTYQSFKKVEANIATLESDKDKSLNATTSRAQTDKIWMIPRTFVMKMELFRPKFLDLHDQELYQYMMMYVPNWGHLANLGYPLSSPLDALGTFVLNHKKPFNSPIEKVEKLENFDFSQKKCDRCGKYFFVRSKNEAKKDKCVYHWGKVQGTDEYNVFMSCCKRSPSHFGCTTAKSHVWSGLNFGLNANLKGFVRSSRPSSSKKNNVFGLDCEMCFTTEGLELVKVALVDLQGEQVYYSLVLPENEVIDFNTRFSGVSEKDFDTFKANSFRTVQEDILNIIGINTIIIGHGLENDLRALKIIHSLVVDTSIVYPHCHGFPSRRPLKKIAEEVLHKQIHEGSHNPVEDANVCVELILRKLEEDFHIIVKRPKK